MRAVRLLLACRVKVRLAAHALYRGMASAVPKKDVNYQGFSPGCPPYSRTKFLKIKNTFAGRSANRRM